MVRNSCGGESANGLAFAAGSSLGLFFEGRGAELGFERHLPGNDAIHVGSACWLDPDFHIPAACTVAAQSDGGVADGAGKASIECPAGV